MKREDGHEKWVNKDLEGVGCGMFEGVIPGFAWRD
jgi:hypothetical protein